MKLLHESSNLFSEVRFFFLYTLTAGEDNEALDGDLNAKLLTDSCSLLGHGEVRVLHEGLVEEADLLAPLLETTNDHLVDDVGRLTGLKRLLSEDTTLGLNNLLVDLGLDSMRLMALVVKWEEIEPSLDFARLWEGGSLGAWWQDVEARRAEG